ncbi:homologous-pairing protein 2 homolog isoform X2 [Rhinolophus ferrumequinum]|uniref:homologous-pairing protein 2 homolog isoform X2 n=1 Tax=Rhinolophus ferrumequinum TaxID=59479 RepID=UPI00140F692A|nr:homologous-pairing protein 2 homolog isoform X2 [Rhinolophus ferrumequinum]
MKSTTVPREGLFIPREGFPFRQSPSRHRKEPLPRATVTSAFPSLAAGKAMSKGRAEAAAGAPEILLRYLQEQNRPYSAQDVFGNLQREHGLGKAAVVKALEQLAQQGKIKEKMYGKQKIYFANQDQFDMVSDADLQGLDAKIVALTAKVQSLQQSCRHMEAELKELTSALTTPEMQKEIQELKKECAGYTERLRNIKAATNHVTPEEKEQSRCTERSRSTARSGGSARGWQQSCVMQSLKDTPRARSSSLRKLG